MIAFPLLTLVAVVLLVRADLAQDRTWVARIKPLASLGFIATALAAGGQDTAYGRMVLLALVLSLLGDIALIGRGRAAFLAGLGAFLCAHLAFLAAFLVRGIDGMGLLVGAVGAGSISWVVGSWLMKSVEEDLKPAVVGYIVALGMMVAAAAGTTLAHEGYVVLIGALLFMGSDIFVARDRLVKPDPINRLWGIPMYYVAQLLLALSVFGAPHHGGH